MRMFIVSLVGLAGLASLFAFCAPARHRAQAVLFGQGAMALSQRTAASAPAQRPEAPQPGGVAASSESAAAPANAT